MKGRELIARIQEYGLEDYDFPICGEDGIFVGYISLEEASRTYKLPISTVRTLVRNNGVNIVNILNKEMVNQEKVNDILKDAQDAKSNTEKWKERKRHEFLRQKHN